MKEKENGITLIALVITILLLVILAAVAINAMSDSQIIEHGMNSSASYIDESINEQKEINQTSNVMNSIITEYTRK